MKKELKWNISLIRREYWEKPEIANIKFEGEENVEQSLYANGISTVNVLELMDKFSLCELTHTLGLEHPSGFLMNAVDVHDGNEDTMGYIAPYFQNRLDAVLIAVHPREIPCIQNDMFMGTANLDLEVGIWRQDEWNRIVDAIEESQSPFGLYVISDMNEPTKFQFKGNNVRIINHDSTPWFVAKDVCDVLGISTYRDAIASLDEDERESVIVDTLGGKQEMASVNEPGLYSLILRSRKPEAKEFKRWVMHEVLPCIRQTGMYATQQAT